MAWDENSRPKRRHRLVRDDQRSPYQRDRDRILYSSAFRRLAGITQIVRAGEADVFHTRLAHTIKVAQVGRRLAEHVCENQPEAASHLGVEPEVVEAACLAHDLGHPPFGHVGESELNRLVEDEGDAGGFEGNAQSFRVLTRLSIRFPECDGLDLTRATLAATLKYPWLRDPTNQARRKKWGAYQDDELDFNFAREDCPSGQKTAEAELMDWADDIAYSIHDLEDFHRCQALAWHRILTDEAKERLVAHATNSWHEHPPDASGRLRDAYERLKDLLVNTVSDLLFEPYEATREQRQQLRWITSVLVGRYINSISLVEDYDFSQSAPCVQINADEQDEVRILKQITRDYIIDNPPLAAQQKGHQRIIGNLFEDLLTDIKNNKIRYLPRKFAHILEDSTSDARMVADCISSLTEAETLALHGRLRGTASGSVLDPIVR